MKTFTAIGTVRLHVLVESPTMRRLKLAAIDERRPASNIVREALGAYLDRRDSDAGDPGRSANHG
jgi:hypothetical protein